MGDGELEPEREKGEGNPGGPVKTGRMVSCAGGNKGQQASTNSVRIWGGQEPVEPEG